MGVLHDRLGVSGYTGHELRVMAARHYSIEYPRLTHVEWLAAACTLERSRVTKRAPLRNYCLGFPVIQGP